MGTELAQSTVIGVLLMATVCVILGSVVTVLSLGFGDSLNTDPISVSVQSDVTSSNVIIKHTAGDSLPVESTDVIIETDDDRIRFPLTNLDQSASGSDGTLTAGEQFSIAHDVSDGQIRVNVVDKSRNTVVHDRTHRINNGIASTIANFQRQSPKDWTGNINSGGEVTVSDSGRTIDISGNRWQQVPFDYNITKNTVVSFQFESDAEGEIHGIGFETDTDQESARVVRVFGVQDWGINVSKYGGNYYSTDRGTVTYTIPFGKIYSENDKLGEVETLLIVNDCDGNLGADCTVPPDSAFRNIQVYEQTG